MSATARSRRRWTEVTIELELREISAELGRFPSRSELVARGRRGLWDAMRAAGGVDAWRQRLEVEAAAVARERTAASRGQIDASQEQIAVRAYELYELGAPGDAVSHWLAAERQLATSPG
jgi:hypothetical protein